MTVRTPRLIASLVAITCAVAACGSDADSDAGSSGVTDGVSPTTSVATSSPTTTAATSTAGASAAAETTGAPTTVPPAVAPTVAPAPVEPTTPPLVFPPAPRVLLIGDSTLQAVGRYNRLPVLLGMDPVYEARSCRLLAVPSCGRNPAPNAVEVLAASEGTFDMVVIMAGYDEWFETFGSSFDQVVAWSREKGAKRIIWLTYPEGVDYLLPDGTPGNGSLVNINQIMRDKMATGAFPDVVIADWFNYASGQGGWFNKDDIHLSPTGATGVADYISRKVAFAASLPCPMPREPGVAAEAPCPDPDATGPLTDVGALYAL
jgi:hypothetical protein